VLSAPPGFGHFHRQLVILGMLLLLDGVVYNSNKGDVLTALKIHRLSLFGSLPMFYGPFSSIPDHTAFLIHGLDGESNRDPPNWHAQTI